MSRVLPIATVALLVVFAPVQLFAGGPPRLCLPIDGVTAENAEVCAKRLADALREINPRAYAQETVEMRKESEQWYAICRIWNEVQLSDIDAALEGTGFTVPRDKLRLFSMVTLQVAHALPRDSVIELLAALPGVSVEDSKEEKDLLVLTLETPHRLTRDIFKSVDKASTGKHDRRSFASADELPSYRALETALAKRKAELVDIRWDMRYVCRMVGCLAVPGADAKQAVAARQ